jgi:hypothetical protein
MVWYAVKYVRKKDRKKKASSHQLCQLNSRECRSFKFREREREREREKSKKENAGPWSSFLLSSLRQQKLHAKP